MTTQDARALTHLARRIREDTHGCAKWDDNGTYAVVAELVGQSLAVCIERVVGHALDPDARTPGAIRRPFTPPKPDGRRPLDVAPVGTRCTICGHTAESCRMRWATDHDFCPPRPRDVDISPVIAELRDHLQPTAEPSPPREHTPNPRADDVRAVLAEKEESA